MLLPLKCTDFISIISQMDVINLTAIKGQWASSSSVQQVADIIIPKNERFVDFNGNITTTDSTKDRHFKVHL